MWRAAGAVASAHLSRACEEGVSACVPLDYCHLDPASRGYSRIVRQIGRVGHLPLARRHLCASAKRQSDEDRRKRSSGTKSLRTFPLEGGGFELSVPREVAFASPRHPEPSHGGSVSKVQPTRIKQVASSSDISTMRSSPMAIWAR
jgi:hypothetical protein